MNSSHTFKNHQIYAATSDCHKREGTIVPIVKDTSGANHNLMPILEIAKINNINKMNRIFGTNIPR